MGKQTIGLLMAVAMVVIIVAVDVAFLRDRYWERLAVNVGIVMIFAACYVRFVRNS